MTRALAILVVLGLAGGTAHAQLAAPAYHRKSHDIAKVLSGGGAGVSTALLLTSFVLTDPHNPYNAPLFYTGAATSLVTPSLGELYAGEYLTWGEAVRAGGIALGIVGALQKHNVSCLGQTDDNTCTEVTTGGVALLSIGLIAYIGGAFYDILDAPDAVDRYNYKARRSVQLTPGPMMSPSGGPPGGGVWLRGSW